MKMDGSLGSPMWASFDGYVDAKKPKTTESTFGTTPLRCPPTVGQF